MLMAVVSGDATVASVGIGVTVGDGVRVGLAVVTLGVAEGDDCGSVGTVEEDPLLHPLAKPASINTPHSTHVLRLPNKKNHRPRLHRGRNPGSAVLGSGLRVCE